MKFKIFIFFFLSAILAFGKSPQLKSVTMTMEPMTAPMQRTDANGSVCGLVKVILPNPNVSFEGNVIGEAEYKTSEYWCYLSPNTRFLKIKYPSLEPLMVAFTEYFTNGIQSKRIYEIVLTVPSITNKVGTPVELKINSSRSVPFWGMDNNERYLRKKNPSWRIGNDTVGQVQVYLNLKEGNFDESLVATTEKPVLLGNVSKGDLLTLIPTNKSFENLNLIITDTVIEKQHVSVTIEKSKSVISGRVINRMDGTPIENAIVELYYVDDAHDYLFWSQKSYGDTLCTSKTTKRGYFGFRNCVSDYTYYFEVMPPAGYHRRYVTNGINYKSNESDSLIISLDPVCVTGIVTDGKNPIDNVKIEFLALNDSQTKTDGEGKFNIEGIKDKIIYISANGFKTLRLDISDYLTHISHDPDWDKSRNLHATKPLIIKLQKGDPEYVVNGIYDYYKERIKKLK